VILILPGNRVSLVGCRPGILAILPLIEAAWAALGYDCLLTSGTDGKHGTNSLHPVPHGLALDSIGVRGATLAPVDDLNRAADLLRRALPSAGFDVVPENFPAKPSRNHLHVERDPKKRPLELWERGGA
jgi:hypothetical protein